MDSILRTYPHAVAGDLVFVSNKAGGLPIETYQRTRGFPHPSKVHVAIVVSPLDMMEAMVGKSAYSMVFPDWITSRAKRFTDDVFHVLRSPKASVENTGKIIDAALYYLDEKYALRDVARDSVRETPVRLGYSICSVLAAKILVRSGAINTEELPLTRQLYPGPMFEILSSLGWYSIDATEIYFRNPVPEMSQSPMNIRQQAMAGTRMLREQTKIASDIVRILDGHLASVPSEDAIYTIANSGETATFDYLAERIVGVIADYARALREKETGALNWKDQETHGSEVSAISKQAIQEAEFVLKLFNALIERIKGSLHSDQFVNELNAACDALKASGVVPQEQVKSLLKRYLDAEINFYAATGEHAELFSETEFQFDFSNIKKALKEDYDDLEQLAESLTGTIESGRAYAASKADVIGNYRDSLRVIVGEEKMDEIGSALETYLTK